MKNKFKYLVVFDSVDKDYLIFRFNGEFWEVLEEISSETCWFNLHVILGLFNEDTLIGKSFEFRRSSRDAVPSWLEREDMSYRVTTGYNLQSILTMSELIS